MSKSIYEKLKKRNLRWEMPKAEQSIVHKIGRAKAERRYKGFFGTPKMGYDVIRGMLKKLIWR